MNLNNYYTIETKQPIIYTSDFSTNNNMLIKADINSNWKYRQYIQKNANEIMKFNTMQSIYSSGNNPYAILNTHATQNVPYLYKSLHDTNNPPYGFRNSDLKQDFINKQRFKSRMVAPNISTDF